MARFKITDEATGVVVEADTREDLLRMAEPVLIPDRARHRLKVLDALRREMRDGCEYGKLWDAAEDVVEEFEA